MLENTGKYRGDSASTATAVVAEQRQRAHVERGDRCEHCQALFEFGDATTTRRERYGYGHYHEGCAVFARSR